ncbi:diguanylate cyclase [Gemmatimonas aurantiaca]|nr:diguanylate cyclase [Gemmatimonas aurantiaca]
MFHCALRQEKVDLIPHLEAIIPGGEISLHYFRTFSDLLRISQRFELDLVVIGGASSFTAEVDLTRRIKENVFTSIIPVALYHLNPERNTKVSAYEAGCDAFIVGPMDEKLFGVRLRMLSLRAKRDISVNPTSLLPGPSLIEREIDRQIALGEEFAVCYTDLDNFKAYNDAYGYFYGDKIIRMTSRIIRDTVFDLCPEGFVGHIGGDDFIYIIPSDLVQRVCETILKVFDTLIPFRYYPHDRARNCIITTNRRGEIESFDLLSVSIAVVINRKKMFTHAGEMSRMLGDLKKYAKSLPGSNYIVERRSKY